MALERAGSDAWASSKYPMRTLTSMFPLSKLLEILIVESELIAEKGRPLAAEALLEELGRGDDRSRGDRDPDLTVRKGLIRVIKLGAPTTIRTKMISSDVVGKCHAHAPSGVAGAWRRYSNHACMGVYPSLVLQPCIRACIMHGVHQQWHDTNSMKYFIMKKLNEHIHRLYLTRKEVMYACLTDEQSEAPTYGTYQQL